MSQELNVALFLTPVSTILNFVFDLKNQKYERQFNTKASSINMHENL